MDLSIIILNYNVYLDVLKCIESVKTTIESNEYEIIVIDNNSSNRDIENLPKIYPKVKLICLNKNYGFGYANNIGMKHASGEYILLVNPDILFTNDTINKLIDYLRDNPNVGVVAPVQIKPNEGIEYYYTFFPSLYSRFMQEFRLYMTAPIMKSRFFDFWDKNISYGKPFKVDWAMGSCMLTRKKIFDKTGGFDEAFFLYEEETEWQYRMKQLGYNSYIIPEAKVLHNHHSSASKLGKMFVFYHEFRSRIIFDYKRFKGIKLVVRKVVIFTGLFLRVVYFSIRSIFEKQSRQKIHIFSDLLKFSLKDSKIILKSRYIFDEKKTLFNL